MAATALSAMLDQLLDEMRWGPALEDGLGYKITGATINAAALTFTSQHPELNRLGANQSTDRLQGWFAYNTDDDEERMITTLATVSGTTTVTCSGANWSGQANATVYLLRVSSVVLIALANDVLEQIPVECMIPLYHGPNSADMQDSDTVDTDWTETNATDTVQTTAAEVWTGARSLVVANSDVNGYTQSSTVRMSQGGAGTAFAIAKADTGQGEFAVFDNTDAEEEVVNFTQEDWLFIRKRFQIDTTDEGVYLRLRGDGASDSIDWQFAWIVKDNTYLFRLPTWIDERFRFAALARAVFRLGGREQDTWLADSVEFERLTEGRDYRTVMRQADANPSQVILEPHIRLDEPLFIIITASYAIAYGVAVTFTTDASTTLCPPRLFVPYWKHLIGLYNSEAFPRFAPRNPIDPLSTPGYTEYLARLQPRQNMGPKRVRYAPSISLGN